MKRLPLSSVNWSVSAVVKSRWVWPGWDWAWLPGYLIVLSSGTTRQVSVWMLGNTGFLVLVMLSWLGLRRNTEDEAAGGCLGAGVNGRGGWRVTREEGSL